MKVIATQFGFFGGARRREGEVFEVGAKDKADWFQPVDGKPDVEKARAEIQAKADAKTKAQGEGVAKAKADAVAKAKAESDKAKADAVAKAKAESDKAKTDADDLV